MSNIKIHCPRCRSTEFKSPGRDIKLKDRITCAKCGHSDTYENIAGPVAKKHAEEELRKAFKNINLNIKL